MHKNELISKLKVHHANFDFRWKGQRTFTAFLAHYLENLSIPEDDEYDFWRIEPFLHDICVDAFEELRTGTCDKTLEFRKMYEKETEHSVPNVLDIGESNMFQRQSAVQTTIGFLLADVLEDDKYISNQVESYCNAQGIVLQQTFDKFLRQVYRQGMFDMITAVDQRGMSGEFGPTTLRTYTMCGRIMFTFANKEEDVTFIAEEGDPNCYNSGLQSLNADFLGALNLIQDVINHWPHVKDAGTFKTKELFIV